MDEGPLEEEDNITIEGGRPPDRWNDHNRGYSRRGRPPKDRGPPDDGGPPDDSELPDDGGPPDDGGSPDDGGPPGNRRNPRHPGRQGSPGPPEPPGPVRPIIVQQPQVTLDTTGFGKYLWNSWPVNVTIG